MANGMSMIRMGAPVTVDGADALMSVTTAIEPEALQASVPGAGGRGFVSRLGKAFQMAWSGAGGGPFQNTWRQRFGALYQILYANTRIDYRREVGHPDQSSLVMAAVNWLARALPEAPVRVEEQVSDADGTRRWQVVEDHPLELLINRPNKFYSNATLWKVYALFWICSGNPYWLKGRNSLGEVIELWPVPDWMMQPRWPEQSGTSVFISHYDYYLDGRAYPLAVEDVVHFRDGVDPDNDRLGLSPLKSLLREIYTDNEASNTSALLMRNCGFTPVVISPKQGVNVSGVDPVKLKQDYLAQTTGDNRGAPVFQSVGVDVQRLTLNVHEMDLKMLRRLPEERVAAVIGIPAIVLGLGAGMDSSTYNNTEQADRRAYRNYLVPLLRYIEQEMTHQLLPDFEGTPKHGAPKRRVRFDLTELQALQDDQKTIVQSAVLAFNGRIIKRSTALEWIGEKAAKDGSDDVYDTGPAAMVKPATEKPKGEPTPSVQDEGDEAVGE